MQDLQAHTHSTRLTYPSSGTGVAALFRGRCALHGFQSLGIPTFQSKGHCTELSDHEVCVHVCAARLHNTCQLTVYRVVLTDHYSQLGVSSSAAGAYGEHWQMF